MTDNVLAFEMLLIPTPPVFFLPLLVPTHPPLQIALSLSLFPLLPSIFLPIFSSLIAHFHSCTPILENTLEIIPIHSHTHTKHTLVHIHTCIFIQTNTHTHTHTHTRCYGNWSGDNCSTFVCDVEQKCLNGGTCFQNPNDVSQFLCACQPPYFGSICQYTVEGTL